MFRPFDNQHLVTLGLLSLCGWLIVLGCRKLGAGGIRRLGWTLAFLLAGYAATVYLQMGLAGELSWKYALPLEVCHWVMIAVIVSLIHPSQLLSEIAYFWGAAGTLQATLTPDISSGFPSWEFILFFWSHGVTLLAILFLIVGRHFRPRPRSVLRMMIAINLYAALVGAFDAVFRCNYGYLCLKPSEPSLMDYLGPWPWYLASLEIIALASFWLLDLPWRIHRHPRDVPRPAGEKQSRPEFR